MQQVFQKTALTLALCAIGLSTAAQAAPAKQYIVKYHDNATLSAAGIQVSAQASVKGISQYSEVGANRVLQKVQAEAINHVPAFNFSVAKLDQSQLKALANDPAVAYVEEDAIRQLYAESTPYGITMVQAPQVSDAYTSNIKVCIVDTGYSLGHPDLPSTGVTGFAFSGHGTWYSDGNGHGTHVAGTIAAIGGNNVGVKGVNPSGKLGLHIVKIFNNSGSWTTASNLVQGIQKCKDAGAKVVSMSLGGSSSTTTERDALNAFYQGGMLLVAAAGNAGNSSLSYPASYPSVMSVASVDSAKNRSSFSQYNSQVEIAAPGSSVQSTYKNNSYATLSGTSMATPHVSGVAALIWSQKLSCSAAKVRAALTATAEDRGSAGRDVYYGFGIVRAQNALTYLLNNPC